jgi:lanthanide-dependent methanol dehydrogenase
MTTFNSLCWGLRVLASVSGAVAQQGEWPVAASDHASARFSPRTDIRVDKVARLKPVFTLFTGVQRGQEAAPLGVGGVSNLPAEA